MMPVPAYGMAQPAYAPYGPAGAEESNRKLIFGVAGCAGLLGLLMLVAGIIYFTTSDPTPDERAEGPAAGPTSTPETGALRSIVREKVGDYTLVGNSDDVVGGRFREGAVDSLALKYRSSSGVELKHVLIAYESEEAAASKPELELEIVRQQVPSTESFRVTKEPYKNKKGETLGVKYHIELKPEIVMWTNGRVFALVEGPPDHALQFFNAVPY